MTLPLEHPVRKSFLTGFNTILRSSTDFKFYKEIFYQPFGKTLRFLLLLVLLVTLVLGIRYSIVFNELSKKGFQWIEEEVPYIEITNGVVTADVEQPYRKEEKNFIMVIDTTGQTLEINSHYDTGILLTRDKLIVKQDEIRTQEIDLSKVNSFRLDKKTLGKWRKFFVGIVTPFMIIMQFVYTFIAKIIQAVVLGLVVLIFRPQFHYSNILNVCIYALTPPTLLALLVALVTPKALLYFPLIYLGMYIAFLVGGIRQVENVEKPFSPQSTQRLS